jgi:hypothetical protein
MTTNFAARPIYLLVVVSLGCSVDRSGLSGVVGLRDASFVSEVVREVRTDVISSREDLSSEKVVPVTVDTGEDFGEDATSSDDLVSDLGPDDLGPDLVGEDSRVAVLDLLPEVRREAGRELGPEAAPDVVPPAREVGPETPKCPAECREGCNVGCGPKGQCLACPTCSCSVESGICHC